MNRALAVAMFLVACSGEQPTESLSDLDQASTVCGAGPTVKGIDVSYYQGNIDWAKVKADGVQYAFLRVSDGLNSPDSKFATYWSQSRANGVLHGAYQFFRPNQDPIAQADLFLDKMGTLKPDDLPPVLDVEADGGLGPAAVASKVDQWLDHVQAAIGRRPIVYTGYYFWTDNVGGANQKMSPLWHAQYTSAACPNIAAPWTDWAFWQYSSTGSVNGIAGSVDMDRFNGTRAQLDAMLMGGGEPAAPCAQLPADGGTIDDGDACFEAGGPQAYMRRVSTAGQGGDLYWTHTTDSAAEANYGQWNLDLAAAGRYRVEVYTDAAFAQSKQARYVVHTAAGDQELMLDQTASDGWQTLGEVDFAAGKDQWIHLADNTGEPGAGNVQLVFDAVRLTPADMPPDDGGEMGDDTMDPVKDGGCNAGGGSAGVLVAVGLVGLVRRRRR